MPTESKVEVSNGRTPTFPKKGKDSLYVVKIKCLPFGFFEKQLWEYFTQFGKVIRARVARSVKTGNHKGWAYVGFENKEVAEIAAETMNGYLMFEKKLLCHVMEKPPKCMLSGPRYVAPPHMKGQAKKAALTMNAKKTEKVEEKLKKRREKEFQGLEKKLKSMGVEYDLSSVPSLSYLSKTTNIKSAEADLVAKKKSVKGPRTGVSKIPKIAKDVTISKKKKVGAK